MQGIRSPSERALSHYWGDSKVSNLTKSPLQLLSKNCDRIIQGPSMVKMSE